MIHIKICNSQASAKLVSDRWPTRDRRFTPRRVGAGLFHLPLLHDNCNRDPIRACGRIYSRTGPMTRQRISRSVKHDSCTADVNLHLFRSVQHGYRLLKTCAASPSFRPSFGIPFSTLPSFPPLPATARGSGERLISPSGPRRGPVAKRVTTFDVFGDRKMVLMTAILVRVHKITKLPTYFTKAQLEKVHMSTLNLTLH